MKSRATESTYGQIKNNMMASGSITKCMAAVTSSGPTASNTSVSSKRTSAMEKASSFGKMAESMKVDGSKANSAASAIIPIIKESRRRVSGKTESAKIGSTKKIEVSILMHISFL